MFECSMKAIVDFIKLKIGEIYEISMVVWFNFRKVDKDRRLIIYMWFIGWWITWSVTKYDRQKEDFLAMDILEWDGKEGGGGKTIGWINMYYPTWRMDRDPFHRNSIISTSFCSRLPAFSPTRLRVTSLLDIRFKGASDYSYYNRNNSETNPINEKLFSNCYMRT